MNYYNILNFKKEPFSNSPEPEFLFQLPQYSECLQKLELAVRLRRGISVVIGDIGTGKTTLCRKLIQNFSSPSAGSTDIETHLLLDPDFNSTLEFLQTVALLFGIKAFNNSSDSELHLKEKIKDYLFEKGIDQNKIVVLVIDEGQKIPDNCLEILREFLNYETNQFKLLQIIIFAQKEFRALLEKKANLLDRVNLLYHLSPLNFQQTRAMINYRLSVARNFEPSPPVFSFMGILAIYLATRGYPRKVVFLCHEVILKMIIRGRQKAGWFLVRSCIQERERPLPGKIRWATAAVLLVAIFGVSVSALKWQGAGIESEKKLSAIQTNPIASANAADNDASAVPADDLNDAQAGKQEVRNIKMPDQIGQISMTKRRTIWWTIHNIYGETDQRIIKNVYALNPHIQNRDVIYEGTVIALPAIPAEIKPVEPSDVIVVLERGHDLEMMYNTFRNNPDEQILPPLIFLSSWSQQKGFEFALVIDQKFKNLESANEVINRLPPVYADRAKVLSPWDEDTVFFNRRALQY